MPIDSLEPMNKSRFPVLLLASAALLLSACSRKQPSAVSGRSLLPATFVLTSTAFDHGSQIPRRFTCDAENISPDLAWSGTPAGTKSLALITDDADGPSGSWTHWLIWNIPSRTNLLPNHFPKKEVTGSDAFQGLNDFNSIGYKGPCPPPGQPHRYFFDLYALSAKLELDPGASRPALVRAIQPYVIAKARLTGIYQR